MKVPVLHCDGHQESTNEQHVGVFQILNADLEHDRTHICWGRFFLFCLFVFTESCRLGSLGWQQSRDGGSTSSAFMMPIIGKRMTGRRAVTARGMHSVHQYRAMMIIA